MIRSPFSPFLVHTVDGESYALAKLDRLWIDPDGELVLIRDEKEGIVLIDVEQISECLFAS